MSSLIKIVPAIALAIVFSPLAAQAHGADAPPQAAGVSEVTQSSTTIAATTIRNADSADALGGLGLIRLYMI
jgi:hypothetical protein